MFFDAMAQIIASLSDLPGGMVLFLAALCWLLPFLAGLGVGAILWRPRPDFTRFELPRPKPRIRNRHD